MKHSSNLATSWSITDDDSDMDSDSHFIIPLNDLLHKGRLSASIRADLVVGLEREIGVRIMMMYGWFCESG